MLDNHYVPDGYGIISNFVILNQKISTYTFFVTIGLLIGIIWFLITIKSKEKNNFSNSIYIVFSALLFGFIGSKILVIIENFDFIIYDTSNIKYFLFTGKSIVGGLLGGYIGVRCIKKILKIENIRIGNNIAPAVALAMAIGRIGCFLTGCCYGIETKLPIGINFGDGVNRIPTQLIELTFCLIMFGYLLYKQKKDKEIIPGLLFKYYVLSYFVFRFLIEFIRETNKNILFLSIYQIICLVGIIYMYFKIKKEKIVWKKKIM